MATSRWWWLNVLVILATLGKLSSSQEAQRCDPSYCRLPECFCGGSQIPGGLKKENTPQFVLLTFDDAVNGLNKEFFKDLFHKRLNPNGCPIKVKYLSTFLSCFTYSVIRIVNYVVAAISLIMVEPKLSNKIEKYYFS